MTWLDPLLDPGSFVPRAQREKKPDPKVGLALLLEGRLLSYRAVAERAGWPDLGAGVSPKARAPSRLLAAIGLHLTGRPQAEGEYRRLLRAQASGMSTLAHLLLSFLYSDTGRGDKAVALLRRRLNASLHPRERTLLLLQLGMRLAELPDLVAAIAETEEARRTGRPRKAGRSAATLDTIAQHNLFAYEMRAGEPVREPQSMPRLSAHAALVRTDLLYAEGLSWFLETSFERSLADPYTRTIRFQAADPVEVALRGALVRAELLSYWPEVHRARKLLGRYLVISRLGTTQGVPAGAVELLRRGGDAKGVEATSRTISRMGPLLPLRAATEALVARDDLGAEEAAASLQLLKRGADLLDQSEAATAARALMARRGFFLEAWSTAPAALARVVEAAPSATQSEVASFVRTLLEEDGHSGLIQAQAQVVEAIRWAEVDTRERAAWLDLIRKNIPSGTDTHVVAVRAAMALASIETLHVTDILEEWFDEQASLEAIAVTFDSFAEPPQWARKGSWPIVSSAMSRIREQAAVGTYGFGTIDVGNLALAVLEYHRPGHPGWDELVDFLLDPRVGISAKARALDRLGHEETRLPRRVRSRLRDDLAAMRGFTDQLGSPPESFVAAKLRLGARVGGINRDEILAGLLGLAGAGDPVGRISAASLLPTIRAPLGAPVALTIGLMLAHDANHDVRGAAARALAQLTGTGEEALDEARRERLIALLAEPGVVVPYGVLAGLFDAAMANEVIDEELRPTVQAMAEQHPSRTMRVGAKTLLTLLERRDRSPAD